MIMAQSGFDQMQLAIDAGILTVESMPGIDVSELEDTYSEAIGGLIERIDHVLTSGKQYPLFDGETNEFVRGGVELGIFAHTPIAKRLGQNAAMADGLFDRLPSFEHATTSEILDIRTDLSPSLRAFRNGVSSLTEHIEVAPEDPQFGNEVVYDVNQAAFNVAGCDFNMEAHWRRVTVPEYSNSHPTAQETNLFRNFAAQVRSGKLNESWFEMALKTQQVMNDCFERARSGST